LAPSGSQCDSGSDGDIVRGHQSWSTIVGPDMRVKTTLNRSGFKADDVTWRSNWDLWGDLLQTGI